MLQASMHLQRKCRVSDPSHLVNVASPYEASSDATSTSPPVQVAYPKRSKLKLGSDRKHESKSNTRKAHLQKGCFQSWGKLIVRQATGIGDHLRLVIGMPWPRLSETHLEIRPAH